MSDALILHAFHSSKSDFGDVLDLQPSHWNAALFLSGGVAGQVLTRDPLSPTGGSWSAVDLSSVVATTRTVNGHPLSADVVVTKSDVGLSAVENTALSTWPGSTAITTVGQLATLKVGGAVLPATVTAYFATTATANPRGVMTAQYSTDALGAHLHFRKRRGTEAASTVVVTADVLGGLHWAGYDGTNDLEMASINVVSTGTIGATRVPTYMTFSVATDAAPSVLTEVLRLTPTGITFGAPLLGAMTTSVNGIAVTSTDGSVLQNTTLATAGVTVQMTPRAVWAGTAYNSVSTLSETRRWWWEGLPITAAGATSGDFKLFTNLNGAAATQLAAINASGTLTLAQGLNLAATSSLSFGGAGFFTGGAATGLYLLRNAAATTGVGFDVATDAVFKVRTRAQTGDASISALLVQVMTAIVAAGGGAAPTFTTIGGSGPATAAQNGWLKFTDSGGVACYVPVWK